MKKRIIFILLIFILSVGFVSASENTTDIISDIESSNQDNQGLIYEDVKYEDIYVNSSKEFEGDGLTPETAYNNLTYESYSNLENNGTIHLADGSYNILEQKGNYTIIGQGENTVITSCWFQSTTTANDNNLITFVNLTFDIPLKREVHETNWIVRGVSFEEIIEYYSISLDGTNFKFINCSFINSSIVAGQYINNIDYGNPIIESTIKSFENCKFLNYSYNSTVMEYYKKIGLDSIRYTEFEAPNLITSFQYTQFNFNNCIFENIAAESIADSRGGLMGSNQIHGGVFITNSSFKKNNIKGIIKAQQISECEIINCTYDFNARLTKDLTAPFYVNKTQGADDLIETKLTVESKDNSIIITLTDIYDNPIVDVEVGIFNITDGLVYDRLITNNNGQIILNNLVGNYNFKFSYLGDPYEYLPTSLNKSFTFESITPTVKKIDSKIIVSNINTVYNTVKKWSFILKDVNNNVLANKKVTVKLDKNYEVTTNNNGQAILTLPSNLIPKTYTATINFAGDNNYNKVSTTAKVIVAKATPKLTTKKLTTKVKVKTKKVTATLKGVPKNTKITLKLKGKTYTAKTNKKGIATFKVTKLNKKGTFKGTVKFAGNKYFKAVSKSVQIKVK